MIYEYRCADGHTLTIVDDKNGTNKAVHDSGNVVCARNGCPHVLKRRFSFAVKADPIPEAYYDASVGQVVRTKQQLDDAYSRLSEERTAHTGVEHNFVAVERGDTIIATPPDFSKQKAETVDRIEQALRDEGLD